MSAGRPVLVVLEWHHLGDAVLAFPFLKAAERLYEVHVFCRPHVAPVFELVLPRNQVHGIEPRWGNFLVMRRIRSQLRALQPAATICSWSDARCAMLMRATGAPVRIGYPMTAENYLGSGIRWRAKLLRRGQILEWMAQRFGPRLLTRELHRRSQWQHRLEDWRQLAEALGFQPDMTLPWFPFEEKRDESAPILAVAPGARSPLRRWPVDRFRAVMEAVRNAVPGIRIQVIQAPGEKWGEAFAGIADVAESPDISGLVRILAQADAVLAHDSFAAHLAAAMGKRLVTIFGPGEPRWFQPGGREESVAIHRNCPHHPCLDRCVMPSVICFDGVKPEMVTKKVLHALAFANAREK